MRENNRNINLSKKLRVLSLFDGISCGMVALERAGIPIEKYYASEIDEYAMKISNKNYPEIIQLGDIRNVSEEILDSIMPIDMIIGGSPCQDLSNYKYDRGEVTGLNGVDACGCAVREPREGGADQHGKAEEQRGKAHQQCAFGAFCLAHCVSSCIFIFLNG